MDALKEKQGKSHEYNSKNKSVDYISEKLDSISNGTLGSYFKWMCEIISVKGMWGFFYGIIQFTIKLLKTIQYYPNIVLHYTFGFVSKPFETITKNISKSKQ